LSIVDWIFFLNEIFLKNNLLFELMIFLSYVM
jgi:hypothetical protein